MLLVEYILAVSLFINMVFTVAVAMRVNDLERDSHPDRGNEFKSVVDGIHSRLSHLERFTEEFVVRELQSTKET